MFHQAVRLGRRYVQRVSPGGQTYYLSYTILTYGGERSLAIRAFVGESHRVDVSHRLYRYLQLRMEMHQFRFCLLVSSCSQPLGSFGKGFRVEYSLRQWLPYVGHQHTRVSIYNTRCSGRCLHRFLHSERHGRGKYSLGQRKTVALRIYLHEGLNGESQGHSTCA